MARGRPLRERLLLLVVGLLVGALAIKWLDDQRRPAPVAQPIVLPPAGELTPGEDRTIALFQAARASVVSITTAAQVIDPFSLRRQEVPQGTGSGILWDGEGHIVTNNHVIEGASSAIVGLADGQKLPAELVGTDPMHDLAVLKIAAETPLSPIPVGTSAGLKVGQSVLAIGNPFGLDWTLTTGVVSALDRQIPERRGQVISGLIQTDAAVNPGNSGGPLIDSGGRLIGMNTAIFSPSGSSAGIGFAVPVDTIARVAPQLIATGRYTPPSLGLQHDDRLDAFAAQQGLRGVAVLGVEPGSPAEAAGLMAATADARGRVTWGDFVTGLNGKPVASSEDLRQALDPLAAGDRVTLELTRGGAKRAVEVTLSAP